MSLNQLLASKGFTTTPAGHFFNIYSKHIMRDGVVIFTGDSAEVWAWVKGQ